jgi:transcriptional regulator NrdR family protein
MPSIRAKLKCPNCQSSNHKAHLIVLRTNERCIGSADKWGRKCKDCGKIFTRAEAEKCLNQDKV